MDRGAWWTRVNWGHRRVTHNLETKTTTISNGLISIHPKHKIIREIFSLRFFCAVFNLMRISKLQPFSIWNHTQVSNIHALTVQNPPASIYAHQIDRTSLVVQWLRLHASVQGAGAQFLVGELRSHVPCSMAKIF